MMAAKAFGSIAMKLLIKTKAVKTISSPISAMPNSRLVMWSRLKRSMIFWKMNLWARSIESHLSLAGRGKLRSEVTPSAEANPLD